MAIHERSRVKKDDFGVTVKNIEHCARCGESHANIWFSRFTHPVVHNDGTKSGYWAMCPVTREPIIMAMQSEQETEVSDGTTE